MIPSPIHKALLTFQKCNARFLLMGGQACILYGASEFSRDLDLNIDIDVGGLESVRAALAELQAESIFLPPLDPAALGRGHACHYRCRIPEAQGLRIDLMTRMRGCDQIRFWFLECRTGAALITLGGQYPELCRLLLEQRALLTHALSADEASLEKACLEEELKEKQLDREYWRPLRAELEEWRRKRG